MNLWRVAIDERSGATQGEPTPVTTPSLWVDGLSFSRDGTRLAYGSLDWRTTLYRAELDAQGGRLAGAPLPVLKGTQPIRDHQLSPDGQWLVFNRVTTQEDLFVARVDGSQSRRLAATSAPMFPGARHHLDALPPGTSSSIVRTIARNSSMGSRSCSASTARARSSATYS